MQLSNLVSGNFIKGAESALKLEERRSQIYKEVAAEIETLGLRENKVGHLHDRCQILRLKIVSLFVYTSDYVASFSFFVILLGQ